VIFNALLIAAATGLVLRRGTVPCFTAFRQFWTLWP